MLSISPNCNQNWAELTRLATTANFWQHLPPQWKWFVYFCTIFEMFLISRTLCILFSTRDWWLMRISITWDMSCWTCVSWPAPRLACTETDCPQESRVERWALSQCHSRFYGSLNISRLFTGNLLWILQTQHSTVRDLNHFLHTFCIALRSAAG